jgi:DNA-binding CsgD family transcriptional regulator
MDALVERIYEAAALPSLWPELLSDVAGYAGTSSAAVVVSSPGQWLGHTVSPEIAEAVNSYLASPYSLESRTLPRLLAAQHPGFLTERDLFTEKEFAADAFYQHLFAPNGFVGGAATSIMLPAGEIGIVQLMAREGSARFDAAAIGRLDALRPHLARSLHLTSRWRLQELRAMTNALELIGLPAAVLAEGARTISANTLVQGLQPYVRWGANDRLRLVDDRADKLLLATLAQVRSAGAPAAKSFPIRSADARSVTLMHVAPIVRQSRDLFGHGLALATIVPVSASAPDPQVIQSLFDLTPAEASIATGLLQGLSVRHIAATRGVSEQTVRVQVRSVLAKTGASRQAEFVALMRGPVAGPRRE